MVKTAVLVSGGGTNLQAILDAKAAGKLPHAEISLVVASRPDAYALLRVPVGVWYAFAAMGHSPALLCNGADIPHDPQEGERLPLGDPRIPYAWEDFPVQG